MTYPYRQCACGKQIHAGGQYECDECETRSAQPKLFSYYVSFQVMDAGEPVITNMVYSSPEPLETKKGIGLWEKSALIYIGDKYDIKVADPTIVLIIPLSS